MRIALGGISHETNTYCTDPTPLEDFEVARGDELTGARGTRSYLGGALDAADELGADVVPILFAFAQPSGTIAAAAYATLRDELVQRLRTAGPVDGVVLLPHGAGVVEGIDDLEADLGRAVRDVVGPGVPIVAPLDLHGNITDAMADVYDAMLGVHFYPHTDMYERGQEATLLLPRLGSGELDPVTHVEHLPMLLPTSTTNFGPAAQTNELCWEMERRPKVIDCTFFHGFPYTDTPDVGCHIVCITDGDSSLARDCARTVAAWVWEHREDFRTDVCDPKEAVRRALAVDGGPVVINDTADNCGGGAPGDSTHLLRAMLEADLDSACFGFIVDPEVAEIAHGAGVGSTITVSLGGRYDDLHGEAVEITGYVKCLSDGKIVLQTFGQGLRLDLGRMARLVVGGVDVIVGSKRSQTFDPEPFLLNGIDVTRYKIVALKSSNHFRAAFEPLAKAIVTADSPGLTTLRTEVFPRSRNTDALWPRDSEAAYP